VGGVYY